LARAREKKLGGAKQAVSQHTAMPPRKRANSEAHEDDATQSQAPTQSQAAPSVDPGELEKLVDAACRYVLMREHSRKPIARAELKEAVFGKERQDRGGKIVKAVLVGANERLAWLCGLELVPASSGNVAEVDESGAGPSQMDGAQEGTQAIKAGGAASKLLLLNILKNAVVPVVGQASVVYNGLVEVILTILTDNGGRLPEADLTETWLPKLGLKAGEPLHDCNPTKVRLAPHSSNPPWLQTGAPPPRAA